MKTSMTNKLFHALIVFLIAGLYFSCTDERESVGLSGGGKEKLVSFSMRVPGAGTPSSYALTEGDENTVNNIVILLFDNTGKYTYQPIYCNKITTDASDSKIKTFSAKVPEGTYSDMLILANSVGVVGSAISGGSINVGDTKARVVSNLLLTNTSKWNSNPGSPGYVDIPMWGEINSITVGSGMPTSNPVSMVRMVSKIDINLGTASKATFKLKSVRLYNYNDKGQIAPDAGNWSTISKEATAASVPTSANKPATPATQALLYNGSSITTPNEACVNEIYTFESEAGTDAGFLNNTCLVIGGYYGSDTQESFYRVDIANTHPTTKVVTYLPLLRNHHYKVIISDISGRGLATDQDAFKSRPVNIKASIMQWSDGRFTEFAVNDQYLLGLSKGKFEFTREKRDANSVDNTLSIITDHPQGWKISKIVDAGTTNTTTWLTCNPNNGNSSAGDNIRLMVDENQSGAKRSAEIHVTADRLTYVVKVEQDIKPKRAAIFSFIKYTNVNGTGQNIPGTGGSVTAEVNTNMAWKLCTNISGLESAMPEPISPIAANHTLSVNIPANTTWTAIPIKVWIDYMGVSLQESIYTQPGYSITASATEVLGKNSGTSTVTITGYRPLLHVRAIIVSSSTVLDSKTVPAGTTMPGNAGLFIPATTVTRNIAIEWSENGSTGWTNITNFTQYNSIAPQFARSNIVWDDTNQRLTFAVTPADNSSIPANSQGLFFKWGSLVAISPAALTGTSATYTAGQYPSGHIIYDPAGVYNYVWSTIPYTSEITAPFNNNVTTEDDFATYNGNTGFNPSTGKGDICRYISSQPGWVSGKWRLPTADEYNQLIAEHAKVKNGTTNSVSIPPPSPTSNHYGRYQWPTGAWFGAGTGGVINSETNPSVGVYLPSSGSRYDATQFIFQYMTFLWTSSSMSTTNANIMYFEGHSNSPATISNHARHRMTPVRCIRE